MERKETFENQSTFDLAFGLATGRFNETDKLIVLDVIKERGDSNVIKNSTTAGSITAIEHSSDKEKTYKAGSKSEKIYRLHKEGKTPKQIYDILRAKKVTVYYAEIYRVTGKKTK